MELVLDKESSIIRHFTGMDKTASELTDGYYQYYIILDIDDYSVSFLQEKVNELLSARNELNKYYIEGSITSQNKEMIDLTNPHIKHPSEFSFVRNKTSGNYDEKANKFTQNFLNQKLSQYKNNFEESPWIAPIMVYIEFLEIFSDIFKSNINKKEILKNLLIFVSPRHRKSKWCFNCS